MTRRRFTDEEIRLLEANPNTQFVSDSMIRFTQNSKTNSGRLFKMDPALKPSSGIRGMIPKFLEIPESITLQTG